jgi:hypothetical protein
MSRNLSRRQRQYLNLTHGPVGRTVISRQGAPAPGRIEMWEGRRQRALDAGHIVAIPWDREVTFARVLYGDVINDCHDPIDDQIPDGSGADDLRAATRRPTVGRWWLETLRNTAGSSRPVGQAEVYFPSQQGVHFALGIDRISENRRIPAGLLGNGDGQLHTVYFDADFLLGPETIHLNVSGQTGLATKTSYLWFLLKAIMERRTVLGRRIAAIVLNTKGSDLLFPDLPNYPSHPFWHERPDALSRLDRGVMMTEAGASCDLGLYAALGLSCDPFDQVTLFVPQDDAGCYHGYRTPIANEQGQPINPLGPAEIRGFCLGLRDFADSLHLFQTREDRDEKLLALEADLLRALEEGYWGVNEEGQRQHHHIPNFDSMLENFQDIVNAAGSHHPATVLRAARRYIGMANRAARVVSRALSGYERQGLRLRELRDGDVWVIDLGRVEGSAEEMLVVHKLLRDLLEVKRSNELAVDDVIVVIDELNKYAPSNPRGEGETISPMRRVLEELTQRARSDRITLFTAQQSLVQVADTVAENLVTRVCGVMSSKEASKADYGLDVTAQYAVRHLEKGEILVEHPIFRGPVKVRFPRPVVLPGKEGQALLPSVGEQGRAARLARLMAGRNGRAMPNEGELEAFLVRVDQEYDLPLDLWCD